MRYALNPYEEPKDVDDSKLLLLLIFMFHERYCPEKEIIGETKRTERPGPFFRWLDSNWPEEQPEIAGVDDATWASARELVSADAISVDGIWLLVILGDLPPPVHGVASVNVVCNVTYEDGSISTSQSFLTKEMVQGTDIRDAVLFTIIRNSFVAMMDSMMTKGIDKLHEQTQVNTFVGPGGEDGFEIAFGGIVKLVLPHLKPEIQPAVLTCMRLMQQCVRPRVPEQIMAAYRAQNSPKPAISPGSARGGWSAPGG